MRTLTYEQKLASKKLSDERARAKYLAKPRKVYFQLTKVKGKKLSEKYWDDKGVPLKRVKRPVARSKKRKAENPTTLLKESIQKLIRARVIERDGGCILRHYPEAGNCADFNKDGELILQAEHLNGRANSVSYGELDNIVCLCRYHHIFFKKQQQARYWVLVQRHLGPQRWARVQAWILDRSPHRFHVSDWKRIEDDLTNGVSV